MAPGPSAADLQALVDGLGRWTGSFARLLRRIVALVASVLAVTALVALALGMWAWGGSPAGIVAVLVLTVPGVVAPVVAARRTRALAAAASDPAETARQARSLFARVREGTDLAELLDRALSMEADSNRTIRGLWRTGRTLGAVVDSVHPDPGTEPLLVAFQPARLRSTWWFLLASVWMWLLSVVICFVAGMSLLADQIT